MNIIRPDFMEKEHSVNIVAPAGSVDQQKLNVGIKKLKNYFTVNYTDTIFKKSGYFAGSDADRSIDLQQAINSNDCGCIIAARGGFGVSRIIDQIDFSALIQSPKWIVGSSDLTVLLLHLWVNYKLMTIHGPMVSGFDKNPSDFKKLLSLLKNEISEESLSLTGMSNGEVAAPMIGGNLTVIAHLAGSIDPGFASDSILFLEDVAEYPYRIDRSITQLKRSGILDNVKGVVLGDFTNCRPGADGMSVEDVLNDHFTGLSIPVASGYPAAHGDNNHPFVHGATTTLTVNSHKKTAVLSQHYK